MKKMAVRKQKFNKQENYKHVNRTESKYFVKITNLINPFLAAGAIWQQKQWSKRFNKI